MFAYICYTLRVHKNKISASPLLLQLRPRGNQTVIYRALYIKRFPKEHMTYNTKKFSSTVKNVQGIQHLLKNNLLFTYLFYVCVLLQLVCNYDVNTSGGIWK